MCLKKAADDQLTKGTKMCVVSCNACRIPIYCTRKAVDRDLTMVGDLTNIRTDLLIEK